MPQGSHWLQAINMWHTGGKTIKGGKKHWDDQVTQHWEKV